MRKLASGGGFGPLRVDDASRLDDRRPSPLDDRCPSALSERVDHEKRETGLTLAGGSSKRNYLIDLDGRSESISPPAARVIPVAIDDADQREGGSIGRCARDDCDHEKRDRSSASARGGSMPKGALPSVSNDGRIGSSGGSSSDALAMAETNDDLTLIAGDGADGLTIRRTPPSSLLVETERPDPAVNGGVDDTSVIVLIGRKVRHAIGSAGEAGCGRSGSTRWPV